MNHFIGWERYINVYISSLFSFDTNISSCSFSFTMDVLILLLKGVIHFGYSILVSIYIMKDRRHANIYYEWLDILY